jgi:hypothetical protein
VKFYCLFAITTLFWLGQVHADNETKNVLEDAKIANVLRLGEMALKGEFSPSTQDKVLNQLILYRRLKLNNALRDNKDVDANILQSKYNPPEVCFLHIRPQLKIMRES